MTSFIMFSADPIVGSILKNTDGKNLIMPLVVQVCGFSIYFLFVILDFFTGISFAIYDAKRKGRKNIFNADKLWKTLWKTLGVLLLSMLVTLLVLFTEIIDSNYAYNFTIWALVLIWVLASLFEFHSIGKNIEKRTGSKPPMFGFMDKVLDAIQKKALSKIGSDETPFEEKEVEEVEEIEENETIK